MSGDVVAYWRDQKWSKGVLSQGGRWFGSGIVIGLVGRNVIVAHCNHIIRCAPEQVRLATNEERCLLETPETQLLGIKDMIEHGTFRSHQYVDLTSQAYPKQEQDVEVGSHEERSASQQTQVTAADALPSSASDQQPSGDKAMSPVQEEPTAVSNAQAPESSSSSRPAPGESSVAVDKSSDYGPFRRQRSRVPSKSGPLTLFRPGTMKQEGFVEVMQEAVPQLIEQTIGGQSTLTKICIRDCGTAAGQAPSYR